MTMTIEEVKAYRKKIAAQLHEANRHHLPPEV